MAAKTNMPARAEIPADELAAIVADIEAKNDLTATGRAVTEVDTNTIVEDRTDAPADSLEDAVEVETVTLDDGTILEHRR